MVNHHETTIWQNMFLLFPSIEQASSGITAAHGKSDGRREGPKLGVFGDHALVALHVVEVRKCLVTFGV